MKKRPAASQVVRLSPPSAKKEGSTWPEPSKPVPPTFELTYRKHVGFVLRQLQRFGVTGGDIEDAAQEVFVTVHRRLGEYDPARASLKTWIYGIVRGVAANRRRLIERRGAAYDEATRVTPEPPPNPETQLEQRRAVELVEDFLSDLSSERRAVFELVDIEGFTSTEAAEALEMNINTVGTRLRAARKEFRTYLARWRQSGGGND